MDKAKTAKSDIKGKNPTPTKSDQNKSSVTGKKELVEIVREKSGLGKEQVQKAIEAVLKGIVESLQKGEEVKLIGFGSFSVQQAAARKGINPKTREPIDIAASNRATFKAGKELKDVLNPTQG